jgi:hypothetical protein
MLSVTMLNVVMLDAAAPQEQEQESLTEGKGSVPFTSFG